VYSDTKPRWEQRHKGSVAHATPLAKDALPAASRWAPSPERYVGRAVWLAEGLSNIRLWSATSKTLSFDLDQGK